MENKIDISAVKKDESKKKTCFIITPIGQEQSEIRRHIDGVIDEVINPVLLELGFDSPVVSHREYTTELIVKSIISKIVNSDLVIANLTTLNANVMYELALRHAIGKPVICIAENGTYLPFDTNDARTIFYSNDMKGAFELKEMLKKFVEKIDYTQEVFDNPITNAVTAIKIENMLFKDKPSESDKFSYLLDRLEKIENSITKSTKQSNTEEVYYKLWRSLFNDKLSSDYYTFDKNIKEIIKIELENDKDN